MPAQKTVVHYKDGRILKGFTRGFQAHRESFELAAGEDAEAAVEEIWAPDLKAVFFVKDFTGNSRCMDSKEFDPNQPLIGRKVSVLFQDGEVLVGTTETYEAGRAGFFVTPADPRSNIERCYVVSAAAHRIVFS